jgi:hypothetical protein
VSQAAQIAASSAAVQQVAAKEVIDALLANPAGLWEADPENDGAAQAGYAYAARVGATATSLRNTRDHAQNATSSAAALTKALEALFAAAAELSTLEPEEVREPPVGRRTVKLVKDEQGLGLKLRVCVAVVRQRETGFYLGGFDWARSNPCVHAVVRRLPRYPYR